MNAIEKLASKVREHIPEAKVFVDAPARAAGTWWLDVARGGSKLYVAWSEKNGFGISSPGAGSFGEGHDEVFGGIAATWKRVRELLNSGERTRSPLASSLRAVRRETNLSQAALAKKLNVNQAAISKLECRGDMLVSTLSSVVAALGGELKIIAQFPQETVSLLPWDHKNAGKTFQKKTTRRARGARVSRPLKP